MLKIANSIFKVLICLTVIVACFAFVPLDEDKFYIFAVDDDYDFENNESYYNNLCMTTSSSSLTDEQKTACRSYQEYLTEKADSYADEIDSIQANIDEIQADITNQTAVITQLNATMEEVNQQISTIESNIAKIEANIEEINQQIEERTARIEELNEQIKARMVANQANVSTDSYISFIMGATSFVDLIRRVSAYNEITEYDVSKIEELNEEKALLEQDILDLEEQKETLVEQQESLAEYQETLEEMSETATALLTSLRAALAEETAAQAELETIQNELTDIVDQIDENLSDYYSSTGWVYPFKTKFTVTSACFWYEETYGSFHPAVDLAAYYGAPVYATANGIVVQTYNKCSTSSGMSCGNNHGNYVEYIVTIGGTAYLVISQHLTSSIEVSAGDIVYAGKTVIGYEGNTGYSFGAHLHQCVIRMGEMSITEAVNSFYSVGYYYYGLGYNINYACYVKGSAPCFEDAEDIYGTYYHHSYN